MPKILTIDGECYLADPKSAVRCILKGVYLRDGFVDDHEPRQLPVLLVDGRVFDGSPVSGAPRPHFELKPLRYGDGDYFGDFLVDAGEFDRCGITPELRGSALAASEGDV